MSTKIKLNRKSKAIRTIIIIVGFIAIGFGFYPTVSKWWTSMQHRIAISQINDAVVKGPEDKYVELREEAHQYNDEFLEDYEYDEDKYFATMGGAWNGAFGRIKIPSIDVDIPIFHTSSDEVLLKGAGHMEETPLPVGGSGVHSAITAHRGLATSKLFTDLDKVKLGDEFTVEVLGEALTYKIDEIRVVEPNETAWLREQTDRDLVTLVTCSPLGINTHRIVATGERIYPTPEYAVNELGAESDQPGFPWWLLLMLPLMGGVVYLSIWATPNVEKRRVEAEEREAEKRKTGFMDDPMKEAPSYEGLKEEVEVPPKESEGERLDEESERLSEYNPFNTEE